MKFVIEHTKNGHRESVTEPQWESIKKKFPGMFKKIQPVENYSDEAKAIIADADTDNEMQ